MTVEPSFSHPAPTNAAPDDPDPVSRLRRWAMVLAWVTVAWNVVEACVALGAGLLADSSALIGFGLDSAIEVSSAVVVLWQFRSHAPQERERLALRLIAISFFVLALWVSVSAGADLIQRSEPEVSPVGIALAVVSVVVMPVLAVAKQRVGRRLGASTVVADSAQTWLCAAMSAVLLVGLGANAVVGWWWADPVAGLVIAAVAAREGFEAWRGDNCCAPIPGGSGGVSGPTTNRSG